MIVKFKNRKEEFLDLVEIIKKQKEKQFYFTLNNQRIYDFDITILKKFLKEAHDIYYDNLDLNGLILINKSIGNNITRRYVKIIADSKNTAKSLLTILLWNYPNKSLCAKIKKDSFLVNAFKDKDFKFIGGRGEEVLLEKNSWKKQNVNSNNYIKN